MYLLSLSLKSGFKQKQKGLKMNWTCYFFIHFKWGAVWPKGHWHELNILLIGEIMLNTNSMLQKCLPSRERCYSRLPSYNVNY